MISRPSLISVKNLKLAWLRIATGRNLQHKRFFRHLYGTYEAGLDANLAFLHEKLIGGWKATPPMRIYLPKASGLLRPITLLAIEDQIVLQAIANRIADQLSERRRKVERKLVFSNCLESKTNSIFFLKDWRHTYSEFKATLERHLHAGNRWIAHFDLAAFYETISHRALKSILTPKLGNLELWADICEWFSVWTSDKHGARVDHGIPQGPIASDFIAEAFLLPVDEAMKRARIKYIRYVDDVRVFARSAKEAKQAAISLELECRKWSLIPQSSKFTVRKAFTLEDALGSLPSIAESTAADEDEPELPRSEAEQTMRAALKGKPLKVVDKTRLRYVLYRASPSPKLFRWTLDLLPRHPEHIDAFVAYLSRYRYSNSIMSRVTALLREGGPYDYVQGELWLIASAIGKRFDLRRLLGVANRISKQKHRSISLERGLLPFLVVCARHELYSRSAMVRRIRKADGYLQSVVVPYFSDSDFRRNGLVSMLLRSPYAEPGLAIGGELVSRKVSLRDLGVQHNELEPRVRHALEGLGIIRKRFGEQFDQIGHIMRSRYDVPYWRKWRSLFGLQYSHALQLLLSADARYDSDKSGWLGWQNSFNDAMFRAIQPHVLASGLPGHALLTGRNGQQIDFGVLLDPNQIFPRTYPDIATPLRLANERRNKIPASHPYDKKTGLPTKYLRRSERDNLATGLTDAYRNVVNLLDPHI